MDAFAIRRDRPAGKPFRFRSLALITLLAGMVLVAGCGSGEDSSDLYGMTRTPPTDVGNVRLPDENPNHANQSDQLRGHEDGLMLVYFGYTFCPDVCPTTLADLRLALADLTPEQRDRVEVGMVTVDPKRDTGKVLTTYLGHFFEKDAYAAFVPGQPRQLALAEEAFGASHNLGKPAPDGSYDVDHTAQLYAVDSDGIVRVEWPFGTDSDDIAADLEALLSETPAQDS
jgi:protein SCO1/2